MQLPNNDGPFHIIGIGGIGMSAIAEVMLARGFDVQGSDLSNNANVSRLRDKGAQVYIGHQAENLGNARYVVISTAVKPGNPEFDAAQALGLPIIRRADMLAALMEARPTISITGTHGKTTTTSLVASLLETAKLDPTVINGGIINAWRSNARIGRGDWMVVEADESDGTFIKLPTRIGIVTNIDAEHMDYFGSVEKLHEAFRTFFTNIPSEGAAIAGIDHPTVRQIVASLTNGQSRRVWTYGEAEDAHLRLENYRTNGAGVTFDVAVNADLSGIPRRMDAVKLNVPGRYNALNALAAIAIACELDISEDVIRTTLAGFGGVKRRFTKTGTWNGVSIYDDYAHHPVEIKEVLKAARQSAKGRVIAIVQPHRYTRLSVLFEEFTACFGDADMVIVTPVYAAGESPIDGVDRDSLVSGLKKNGHDRVIAVSDDRALAPLIAELAKPADLVIGLGAGTISEWTQALPRQLAELSAPLEHRL